MTNKDIAYISLFAAICAGLGIFPSIIIPIIPIPITTQSMGPMLCGSILGAKRGGLSILLFITLVAIGMPVLSGGRGGLAAVTTSPFAGYIYAWIIAAIIIGILTKMFWRYYNFYYAILFNIIGGIICVYPIGVGWYAFITGSSFLHALLQNAIFIPGDLIKAVLSALIAVKIKKIFPLIT